MSFIVWVGFPRSAMILWENRSKITIWVVWVFTLRRLTSYRQHTMRRALKNDRLPKGYMEKKKFLRRRSSSPPGQPTKIQYDSNKCTENELSFTLFIIHPNETKRMTSTPTIRVKSLLQEIKSSLMPILKKKHSLIIAPLNQTLNSSGRSK